jgi:hypothetical protein
MPCHKQADSYQSYPKNLFMIFLVSEVLAGDLVDNLMEQIKQFEPGLPWENVPDQSKNKKMVRLS